MAWTQADLDALDAALALGAREVRYADGRMVVYRSVREMMGIRGGIVATLTGTGVRTLGDDRVATGMSTGVMRGAPSYGYPYPGRLIP
ncbi:hypothetical protein EYW49_20610 [Siculibacillus lacustris]|uniref:Uncharacterized protein n=1 Tax=Siculibacillus lacustris TaxID=1549641 RepID=A0A4Q9VEV7_9HYPH|nr:hypothetical protein [Siculibacillus lacustris]TBW33364.1 hypothetical protein EYW49_20610 [Siculibacillus lacustris]